MQPEPLMPPHSTIAEQSVLGALLIDSEAWHEVADLLTAESFYQFEHRQVFAAIAELRSADKPADVVTVSDHNPDLERSLLADLADGMPNAANIRAYAMTVAEKADRRRLIKASTKVMEGAYRSTPISELMADAERVILRSGAATGVESKRIRDLVPGVIEEIQARADGSLAGIGTGLRDLDTKILGMEAGDLLVLAARPSMGKTGFAIGMADHVARYVGDVAFFSLEMPERQIVMRWISRTGHFNSSDLRAPKNLSTEGWGRLGTAANEVSQLPLHIFGRSSMTPREMRSAAVKLHRRSPLKLVIVDYLQKMQGEGENRTNQIGDVSHQLKALALDLQCPVIALSQLSRAVENRPDRRPRMSDLRDSGGIEQDADVVAFIYRDEVYNPDSPERGVAEIIIGKQRNGPIGTVRAAFHEQTASFRDLAPDYTPPKPQPNRRNWKAKGFEAEA